MRARLLAEPETSFASVIWDAALLWPQDTRDVRGGQSGQSSVEVGVREDGVWQRFSLPFGKHTRHGMVLFGHSVR